MSGLHDLASAALRRLDPEDAHRLAVRGLAWGLGPKDRGGDDPILATRLAGLELPNPVGLAAGFDKDGETPDAMLDAGFGFVECGTVTPLPQAGNARPRLFRLTADRAVINRMGFNNKGLSTFAERLGGRPRRGVVGANIGANKDSDDRIGDYVLGLKRLEGLCDYLTVNISSPNTPGLRALQSKAALNELFGRLAPARGPAATRPPLLLKIAPDLDDEELAAIVEASIDHGVEGLIVSNTTLARPAWLASSQAPEAGGLSGAPLFEPSTAILAKAARLAKGRLVLVGAGGVSSGAQAYAKLKAGASAVQLYSALVYGGPSLVVRIKRELAALLRADGLGSVGEAVGTGLA